jgi:hypothetical protein
MPFGIPSTVGRTTHRKSPKRYKAYFKSEGVDQDDPLFFYPTTYTPVLTYPGAVYPVHTYTTAYYPAPTLATAYTPLVTYPVTTYPTLTYF